VKTWNPLYAEGDGIPCVALKKKQQCQGSTLMDRERIASEGIHYVVCCRASGARALAGTLLALSVLIAGCSSGGPASSAAAPVTPAATTQVNLVVSSEANDQLAIFAAQLQSVTLSNSSGHSVTLLSSPLFLEFMHFNGVAGPLATATIPQDTYTSATVAVGNAQFSCDFINASGALNLATFAYGYMPAGHVTVTLPQPITVTGDSMGIALGLLVSQSATAGSCTADAPTQNSIALYSITPTFELTGVVSTDAVAAARYLSVKEYMGEIGTFDAASGILQLQVPSAADQTNGPVSLQVSVDTATVLQGVSSTAGLNAGTFVTLDGMLRADGSVRATRIAVADPLAVNVRRGPVLMVPSSEPVVQMQPIQGQGADNVVDMESFDFAGTSFRISGELSNLQQLPFTASFTNANMVAGQNIYVSAPQYILSGGFSYYAAATTITLMPQTIDGTVYSVGGSGNFTVYGVELGSQDLFPSLAVQAGQTTRLTQPGQIQVYVDNNTQQLASTPVTVDAPARFYGLVFNDNGVLRMDAAAIFDGLAP
jgi:hypothetical protein